MRFVEEIFDQPHEASNSNKNSKKKQKYTHDYWDTNRGDSQCNAAVYESNGRTQKKQKGL